MANALQAIVEWAKTLPDWQSDAMRRLLIQNELSSSDFAEIKRILLGNHGLDNSAVAAPKAQPLSASDIPGGSSLAPTIVLKSVTLSGVNAIPDGTTLPFGHEGMTVLYGENSAGKSGYARVLKKACRARDASDPVRANVFASGSAASPKATLKIAQKDSVDEDVIWQEGQKGSEVLSNILVFDSKCARVIVDEENEAYYLPYGTHVFGALGALLQKLKEELTKDKPELPEIDRTDILDSTPAGKLLAKLDASPEIKDIEAMAVWSAEDEKALSASETALAKAKLENPAAVATRLRNTKGRFAALRGVLVSLHETFCDKGILSVNSAIESLCTAESALQSISADALGSEPLPGCGTDVWRTLYNAAREYSTKLAYPGKGFPIDEEGARCVLCMQVIEDEAKDRFGRFKAFMENAVATQVEQARLGLASIQKGLEKLDIPTAQQYKDVLDDIQGREPAIAADLRNYLVKAVTARSELDQAIKTRRAVALTQLPETHIAEIQKYGEMLEEEAKTAEARSKPEELTRLDTECSDLKARKLFSSRKSSIINYLSKAKQISQYEACIGETNPRAITEKGKKVISEALTPSLLSSLQAELDGLGAGHLPLKLRPSTTGGETRHQIVLDGAKLPRGTGLTMILSEGEQKVVALAGFLAELHVGSHMCPIIFDDPVCSLDHRFRLKIAERLAAEAKTRQVIIFTHDIAFLVELEAAVDKLGNVPWTAQTIRRQGTTAGVNTNGRPWHAMTAKERIGYLKNSLSGIKSLATKDQVAYNREATRIYGMLRESWEAAVEHVLLNGIVLRHRISVETQRLKAITVTDEDFKAVWLGMAKSSEWMTGHDRSQSLDVNRPGSAEIERDIGALETFIKATTTRNEGTQKARSDLLKAPSSQIG